MWCICVISQCITAYQLTTLFAPNKFHLKQGEKDGNFNPVTEDTQFESGETIILGNGEGVWANVGVRFFVNKKKISIF